MRFSTARANLIANFVGRIIALLTTLGFLPAYLKVLGSETFGLVGFYSSLVSVLTLTDLGLSATLTRELARLSATGNLQSMRRTMRTLEILYAAIIGGFVVALLIGAPFIGERWINAAQAQTSDTVSAIRLMSIAAAFQLGSSIYQGGLVGLQRHVQLNVVLSVSAVGRGIATLGGLLLFENSAQVFFVFQVLAGATTLVWIRCATWAALRLPTHTPRFDGTVVRSAWRYATSMLAMTVTGTALMQSDKLVLSRMLSLDHFGYYTLAWTVAQLPLSLLSTPIQNTFLPRMTRLVAEGNHLELARVFHVSSQVMAVVVMPVAAVLALFPEQVLSVWLGQGEAARMAAVALQFLVVGSALGALTAMPYAAQLAHGRPQLSLAFNSIAVPLFVPGLIILSQTMGMRGAGITWALLNVLYVCVIASLLYRRILIGEGLNWLAYSVTLPTCVAFCVSWLLSVFVSFPANRLTLAVVVGGCWLCVQAATLIASPSIWSQLMRFVRARRRNYV